MTLQFHMTPGSCTTGIHILLAARTLELMDYAVDTVHSQGFTRIFTTERYLPEGLSTSDTALWTAEITARGQAIVRESFAVIEAGLPETSYAMGPDFTIADAALFYVFFWASKTNIEMPPRCQALFERLRERPVVHQVLREEGYR